MYNIKQLIKASLFSTLAIAAASCSSNDNDNPQPIDGEKVYTLGLGVTTTEATTNYVLGTNDLMTGTLSLTNNGLLQTGYRDFLSVGSSFFSIGGLGVTDVNVISLDASGNLTTKSGLTFPNAATDIKDVDGQGKTLLATFASASLVADAKAEFYTVNVASNSITSTKTVTMRSLYPSNTESWLHTGIVVRGTNAFQTFYPIDPATYATNNTDTAYVAVYNYPDFTLQKVIKDVRTGPAGSFGTRSGIFVTESGDVYTVAHNGYGYSKSTKEAGILKIANGTTEFDANYYFNTATATNGGRIVHAMYIGNNKLFAEISTGTQASQWVDGNLKFAIVDLSAKTITAVTNSPTFTGDGGRSFAALYDDGKAYAAATVNGVCNIYQIDVATATATKGAVVGATFVGGIGRVK
ncbi:DUF4374 domain-containing protein [Mucilaginibacter sp. JRF]|uniref:DUF4374 domain-containing protein n=1 Tax=Mucilaginibacter sp. JRF TaxID=2780088 RepID=UPI0018823C08|nr:DUF4374 domain-containing protein [Mucilaginibacter sp. JRF]MBE9584276.1 DUF4374 domain-containing protein [Mucilaginibacter sp. JRF]